MTRQPARDGVDGKTHILTLRAQLAHQFRNRLLRLGDGHAIARDDDDAIGFIQSRRNPICVNRHLLAFHRHLRTSCSAKAAKDHADKRAVHRFAHDVRQNRT